MVLCIAREHGHVDDDVLDFLLKGNISLEKSSFSNPLPTVNNVGKTFNN
jgi:hypothetical protein